MIKNKKELITYSEFLLFGLISALVLVKPHLFNIGNGWIPQFRIERLEWALESLKNVGKFDFSCLTHTLGYVLYFPMLMKEFSIYSGADMFSLAQCIAGGIVIMVYPLLMYKLFDSRILAFISPIILQFTVGDLLYINKASEYWSGCWALALGLPLLCLFIKESNERKRTVITICMALIMALANILRSQSGFPLLLAFFAAMGVLFLKKRIGLKRVCAYVLVCICTFNLLGTTIPDAVAHKWGYDGVAGYNSSPWHSMLIGMGYINNAYGLYYSDDSAKEIIEKIAPDIEYNSNEYYNACKKEALKIIKDDPIFVIKGLVAKLGKCIQLQIEYILGNSPLSYYWHPYIFCLIVILINGILMISKKRIRAYIKKYGFEFILCLGGWFVPYILVFLPILPSIIFGEDLEAWVYYL